ncbi:tRNA pseudouridine(55) synthase TruB [Buchnera aphidicola]|uniref:tRNA pseudouridine synthase B n=1 Tax=Buchnera aphidicola subsp. Cinara cedri (strain Cc) TaxID=372461 RepID=Q057K1_BUCCC|nr:tRNA pseudouridine(55) synthase TruB [Buchnera aphidicola]ABJ90698.1 tRNA pseudouridine 55 synthetase [Buchnera aphidicola BCc]
MVFQNNKNYNGILLLDKPKGISSNGILQQIKKIFLAKKAGYTGSLDPMATGMLPILFGNATKFSKYLTDSAKKYHVIAKLGETTSTGDLSGKKLKIKSININTNDIYKILNSFIGEIYQVPPMFSAIKYNGIPLYKYARLGILVPRKKRKLFIYKINFIQFVNPFLEFTVICSKGTYIRSLVNDIGNKLFCGGHVIFLRRLYIKPYNSSKLVTLSNLHFIENKNIEQIHKFYLFNMLNTFLLPVSSFFFKYPIIKILHSDINNFQKKIKIALNFFSTIGLVQVITKKNNIFLGIGKINKFGILTPKCVLCS